MLRFLRHKDVVICTCSGPPGIIFDTLQYTVVLENRLIAIVTSLCNNCGGVFPIITGVPRIITHNKPTAYEHSIIICGKGIPSTKKTFFEL